MDAGLFGRGLPSSRHQNVCHPFNVQTANVERKVYARCQFTLIRSEQMKVCFICIGLMENGHCHQMSENGLFCH